MSIPNRSKNINGKKVPTVAIGASAGGIEAVVELLANLPADTGMAYVYIQHLDPTHSSNLDQVLGRATKMRVVEATEEVHVEPDNVYIIPPNKEMIFADGALKLNSRPSGIYVNMPVNKFFLSLAEENQEAAIGIILSGAANDGTIGLKAIKLAGGLAFAQDESAKFQSMPKSAIAEGAVDLILSPKEIAEELISISHSKEAYYSALNELENDVSVNRDEEIETILIHLYKTIGVDFRQYKVNTIKRRIMRRMMLHKMETLGEYAKHLKQNPKEVNLLYTDLLINVTTFFRDEATVEYLRNTLFPGIIKSKSSGEPIRLWVPACSTGQEVYSLAILLTEALGTKAPSTPIQIFATDLSEAAINKARLGVYTKNEVIDVPQNLLQNFFTKADGHYRIVKSIRDLCVFATHNIAKDPPFSRLDVISCCNLLIYLDVALQKRLFNTFHYSLNNTGYLILGKSETVGNATNLFAPVSSNKLKIYSKKKDALAKATFEMNYRHADVYKEEDVPGKQGLEKTKEYDVDIDKKIDVQLLKRYTPAAVVVTQELDILQFRGSTGTYLEPSPGKASLNLLKMAKPGLGIELRNIVYKAKKTSEPARKEGLEITHNNKKLTITIEAVPMKGDAEEEIYLVVFEEMIMPQYEDGVSVKDKRVLQLEAELTALREDMRSIIESQEAANEELQSANEEIVSSNEELQSINEELETSKEEIESSNEELITINQELQERNEQLAEVQEYAESVFSTMRESLLVLDKNFRVKHANKSFYQTFKVTEEETEGRLLYELGNRQWSIAKLRHLLEEIIPENLQVENFEVQHNFDKIGHKTMMLNARQIMQSSNRQNLILLAIEDITEFRKAEKIIEERETWLRNMADNAPIMMWVSKNNKKSRFFNKTWLDFCGKTLEEALEDDWLCCVHPEDVEHCNKVWNISFDQKKQFEVKHRLKHYSGDYRWLTTKAKPNFTTEGNFAGFIGISVELNEQ